jgi:predicted ATPase
VDTDSPIIVTTSQLLTTGVDIPTCKNVVIARVINSMIEFKQIIGRGTRVREDEGKLSFTAGWQESGRRDLLDQLAAYLADLGLTRSLEAQVRDSTRIDLLVDRMPVGSARKSADMVNIADVGISVSQTLPVLVALLVAAPGQLVVIEQPELHLHLSAQVRLAHALADAARRGVRVVVETHSSLLLLSIQTLVAQGLLPPDLVKLHWFERDSAGMTRVTSADLDSAGSFGEWPEDFDTVELDTQRHYLDAAEARQAGS